MPGPESDSLWESGAVNDYPDANRTAVSRVRIGYPRLAQINSTNSDLATARAALTGLAGLPSYGNDGAPLAPATDDALADVKRALAFRPSTGLTLISGARFASYLRNNSETRVADGAVIFNVVDQGFVPNPDDPSVTRPGLSYLRLGKPEPTVLDGENNPLARQYDQMMDQKYGPGVGLFSDGGFNAWTRQPINLRSNQAINLNGSSIVLTSYDGATVVSYEIKEKSDIERINAGEITDVSVDRRIININWLRNTPIGWYRQIFDRGKALTYTTANKGDFSNASQYSLSLGAKFEHTLAVGLSTEFSGKITVSKGFSAEIGTSGAIFKHPFGAWTKETTAEVTGDMKVKLSISGIETASMELEMKIFSGLLHAAVATQTIAFTAYNSTLADRADRPLTAADAPDAGGRGDNAHGMLDAFDKGLDIYEAAISLSAITAAAGCVMAARQAFLSNLRLVPIPVTPTIEVSRTGINLICGASYIQMGFEGIRIGSPGTVVIGGSTLNLMSPATHHLPTPPLPPKPML